MTPDGAEEALRKALEGHGALAVAVSGGIDSLLLGTLAHRWLAEKPVICHGASPAVPAAATERVRHLAAAEGWRLEILPAVEFGDPRYLANPCNRCYFCKSDLFAAMRRLTERVPATGANLDDLKENRPGMAAAREYGAVHPFVEAGIDKAMIRALARKNGLGKLADLPAESCLSTRIETGIPIVSADLAFAERTESALRLLLSGRETLRCRITGEGVVIECTPLPEGQNREEVDLVASELCRKAGRTFAGMRAYRRGSASIGGDGA